MLHEFFHTVNHTVIWKDADDLGQLCWNPSQDFVHISQTSTSVGILTSHYKPITNPLRHKETESQTLGLRCDARESQETCR